MASQYAVVQDALIRFSRSAQDRADRLRGIREALSSHSPGAHAFGKLPESEQTGQDYRERVDATLENLDVAAGQQDQIADFIARTARSYQEVEDHTVDHIRSLADRPGGTA
ncbi:hypothetical protein GTU99_29430 [Streptomyces sp. PRKS01-65]|nr:hypothetical protein [Streptomyces harenosi]NEY36233.1 hypothetical protein [Streptomyces harenosi]